MSLRYFAPWARFEGLEILLLATGVVLVARLVRWLADLMIVGSELRDARVRSGGLVASEQSKHERALVQVVAWSTIFLLYFVTMLVVLEKFNVPLTSLVAPATVAGLALGFGAQRVVADVLSGFFLFAERQFGFGDVIRIAPPGTEGGITGVVEELTLRTTRLRTVDGELIVIPNGEVRQVTNLSKDWARVVIDIPLPSETDITKVSATLRTIGEEMMVDETWSSLLLDEPSVMGVEHLEPGFVHLRFVARTLPGKQWQVGRELRGRIAGRLRESGTIIPASFLTAEVSGS